MGSGKDDKAMFRDKEHEPISFKFRLIHEAFSASINRQLKEDDMTFSQIMVLFYLFENRDKKVMQKDISDALHIKHPTTIGLLKRLEEKEMLEVSVDEDNRKCRNIVLTKKGFEFIDHDHNRRHRREKALVSGMSDEEIAQLRRLLDKVIDNMSEENS